MINVEFTENEATVLMNLIDIAVKSAGLPAAASALHFSKKIQEAAKATGLDGTTATDTKE
jgi:hypothetical protein